MDATIYRPGQEVPGTVYRVIKHLATGGMGSVYEVEDTSVEKHYVMKTLHPQLLAREDLAKRMKEEAKMLAKLHHPNIVDVVTAGITQDAQRVPYYVMERLNGVNLRHMLEKKGALDLVYALRVAIDVLDALEHAHDHGVIHRDVKPENIFLHRNASGTTTTKLLDFGIMRLIDRKSTDVTRGKFVGTIRYASPEQVMGEQVEGTSDLYAVGLLLYEMIAGRGPFDDVDEVYAIGMAHVQRPPPPLSQFAPAVPKEIEQLVHAALAKKPHERPQDAFTFSSELRRLMPGGPMSPRAPHVSANMNALTPSPSDPIAYGATEAQRTPPHMTPPHVTPIHGVPTNATSMAGEAQTRPPSSPMSPAVFASAIIAALLGVGLIGGALLYVVRSGSPPATTIASPAPVIPAASASASASAATPMPPVSASAPGSASSVAGPALSTAAGPASAQPRPKVAPVSVPPAKTAPKKPVRPEDVGFE